MEDESDSEVVLDIAVDLMDRYQIKSWSFDKGFWNPVNNELLQGLVERVIMPKKDVVMSKKKLKKHIVSLSVFAINTVR